MQPTDHLINGLTVSGYDCLHSSVRKVADPTGQSDVDCLFPGIIPEENPLNPSGNDGVYDFIGHGERFLVYV